MPPTTPDRYAYQLLEVALDLHTSAVGTSDPMPDDMHQRLTTWLRMRLDTWAPSFPRSANFDAAIRALCVAALDEATRLEQPEPPAQSRDSCEP